MSDIKRIPFINTIEDVSSFSLRVALIIASDTKILMVKNEGKEKYKHVGRHVKLSETLCKALKREVAEEIGEYNFELPQEPIFFDQIRVNGDLMINAYLAIKLNEGDIETMSQNSKLPSRLFTLDELNNEVTFESEIGAIKHCFAKTVDV